MSGREGVEQRLAKVEGRLEELSKRLDDLRNDVNHLRDELRSLGEKVDRNFRWTIGIMLSVLIPMWVTIILAILLR